MSTIRRTTMLLLLVPAWALAQPAGSAGSADSAGSAPAPAPAPAPEAGSGAPASAPVPPPPEPAPPPADEPVTGDVAALRKTCAAAMNADPSFADSIIKTAEMQLADKLDEEQVKKDLCTVYAHSSAQEDIATNERHVLMAYIAMWLVAAGFVVFLWRRQQSLKGELAQLRRELEAATKDER